MTVQVSHISQSHVEIEIIDAIDHRIHTKITEHSPAADIWVQYQTEKRKVLEPLATSFRIMANEAKEAKSEAERLSHALNVAEARIKELEDEVEMLAHYRDVVEQALADAE